MNAQTTGAIDTWKAVAGFDGRYEVSDQGRVRSRVRYPDSPRPLKPNTNGNSGHLWLDLGGRKFYVHQLVLLTFVGPAPPRTEARHLDGDPSNNYLGNLSLGSRRQNLLDRTAHNSDWSIRHSAAMRKGWVRRRQRFEPTL